MRLLLKAIWHEIKVLWCLFWKHIHKHKEAYLLLEIDGNNAIHVLDRCQGKPKTPAKPPTRWILETEAYNLMADFLHNTL